MDLLLTFVFSSNIKKFVDVIKFIRAKDWSSVTTQAIAWVSGVLLTYIASKSALASTIHFGNFDMKNASIATCLLIGISLGSAISLFGNDLLAAVDNTRSSSTPSLLDQLETSAATSGEASEQTK